MGELDGVRGAGAPVSEELVEAWRANARCAECGRLIGAVAEAALVVGPNRVTHRERCFVPALLRANPRLRLLSARPVAQEVTIAPNHNTVPVQLPLFTARGAVDGEYGG